MRLVITTIFLLSFLLSNAQIGLKSSSINSAGGMKFSHSSQLTLINATSQSSSIQIQKSKKYTLRQGFVQPLKSVETFGMAIISVYPNPTEGPITLEIEGRKKEISIALYNQRGLLVLSQSVLPGIQMDLSSFPKGVYHLVIKQYGSYLGTRKILLL